ncbi:MULTISPECIES: efflux RND transporter periplasmic adaptor subunit [Leptospirillum]|jgi:RND family efflux transporter MFP subunit|uniref:Hemolysin D n=2 Tax=Leptospirillum ferriphilum TaxID=178606 RepID=A0A059XVT6_9BACT|nr:MULTISPECIES: efflux RND transporter periplasmic adaptor subunit [Leptospirillum]EAY56479.1 MAG: Secretion protein (HlyD) [Leptospirillum rubarum]EIJ75718.1 MAG: Secretion protein (HlyD) [Leptospirillum sp. Group II 'C75']AIA31003.1 hemolysin D [Leptospirillum ferriphilum YSK]OOH74280.1 efflux transporter periplasmic adaptor subunit [Leptospirillum ferriphilum]OOH84122.1 efflux transporter periplasmic adaptor subunit [Leptospirillum ferriphilum]
MNMKKLSPIQTGILVFLGGAILFALQGRFHLFHFSLFSRPPKPVLFRMPVPVALVEQKTVPVTKTYVGTTEAIKNVTLQAMVTGYLKAQLVPDGSDVRKGAVIYTIDSRYYQASVDQARAQKERDAANLEYARVNQHRNALMVIHGDVSKDAYDLATSTMHQARSSVLSDKANEELARINLGYTRIVAPFAGRLSHSQAFKGSLIASGTTLNTLVQLDPIYATFNPPEPDLPLISANRRKGPLPAVITLADNPDSRYRGRLTFLDNTVDRTTGTITARVTISNPDKTLLPGQFVRIHLHIGDHPAALLVPQVAIGSSQVGKYVYVIGKGNIAEMRFVSLGSTYGDMTEVTKGVHPGEAVIVGNQQKIGPGMPVLPLYPKKTNARS